MKINVEFDLTPDEFRRALGLPDVEAFQQDLLERIQKQMESGVEGYDPMSLMQPFLQQPLFQQGMANFGNYQQMMMDMLSRAASGAARSQENDPDEPPSGASGQGAGKASSASAQSRSRRKS